MSDEFRRHVQGVRVRHAEEGRVPGFVKWGAVIVGGIILALVAFWILTERVDATEECVVKVNGREVGTIGPGLRFVSPWTSFECYTVTQKTIWMPTV